MAHILKVESDIIQSGLRIYSIAIHNKRFCQVLLSNTTYWKV